MTQQVISSTFSITGSLKFIPESNLSLAGFDVCYPRHPIYLFFPSLGVIIRVLTALHLYIAHDDDITRHLAIAMKTINLLHIHIIICRNLQLIIR